MRHVTQHHREAMDLAEQAEVAKLRGDEKLAADLSRRAFEAERRAAMELLSKLDLEPTRSVLFRSAASLALDAENREGAEKMASLGLGGSPPPEIADELRQIIEEAGFRHHLALRGIRLLSEEFQVSMTGPAISTGVAKSDVVLARVEGLRDVLYRTAERKAGVDYRTGGRRSRRFLDAFQPYLGVPRAGSFAFTIRLGESQTSLPGFSPADPVIDELFKCLELFASNREEALRERIPDEAYFGNFVSLARKIAPDGAAVSRVGFTKVREGKEQVVQLRPITPVVPRVGVAPPTLVRPLEPTIVRLHGELRWASAPRGRNEVVKVVEANGTAHMVRVPMGYDDIVKPHWLDDVIVTGRRGPRGRIILVDIESADSEDDEGGR